ncbi:hypothetical protein BJV85_003733 [Clostridium acetobutylicum]|uniref:Uncharacterized protein n=1 Tax=Clostridium acetobutylicum (strain ATCC 824 / DSM 792 / JCM 1419 / IAM 19013 / LMG 5710 / NBRC 13948 / NRRL B-527 / VKM B-1787 / 2291 / W) TaxID=272562 RepID=Q97MA6_CLOAB|nr:MULTISPECIES: DUF3006 domain-containing protein [Clostridium]AAK78273.1 Hypothetical protein CA_C0292 [Clostridium acetobutylicum ATCC 824]ADZ19340.1 Conserved hypothetical protein [Clostridium acetobutylicum EA 2018]AEI31152.1 hypothetical protein SMB_G0298 [Clostridium acetobutylicum DSM 1731]AWV79999.1 DUF3006 domain-containing protein [Clostridium acetobutylicum]KHD34047.1 pyruvate kinase [Clostridium acetobutylicum]
MIFIKAVIDRFEDEFAVCEKQDRKIINILRKRIPQNAKEGTVLNFNDDGSITINFEETIKRKREIEEIMKDLFT